MPGIFDDERRSDWRIWARPSGLAQNRPQRRRKCSKVGRALPCAFLLFADDFASNAASRVDTQQTLARPPIGQFRPQSQMHRAACGVSRALPAKSEPF